MMKQTDKQDWREEASVTAFLSLLGALDAEEQQAFEAWQLEGDSAAISAAREAEELALALATAVPEQAPSPDLRRRLFDTIGKESVPSFAAERTAWLKSFLVKATDLAWEAFAPGVQVKWLFRDQNRREYVALLKAVAGSCYPAHRHVGVEEVLMLDGRLRLDEREYVDGDFVRSEPDTIHHHTEAVEECTFIIHSSFDVDLL